MQKEILTLDVVKQDLRKMVGFDQTHVAEHRVPFILLGGGIAVGAGILCQSLWIALLLSSFAIYQTVQLIRELRADSALMNTIFCAVERGDFTVSTEILENVSEEIQYKRVGRHRRAYPVRYLCFRTGRRWRIPDGTSYEWSMRYAMSGQGLDYTSVNEDEFYVITLQGYYHVAYVYNKKLFELGFPERAER